MGVSYLRYRLPFTHASCFQMPEGSVILQYFFSDGVFCADSLKSGLYLVPYNHRPDILLSSAMFILTQDKGKIQTCIDVSIRY